MTLKKHSDCAILKAMSAMWLSQPGVAIKQSIMMLYSEHRRSSLVHSTQLIQNTRCTLWQILPGEIILFSGHPSSQQ